MNRSRTLKWIAGIILAPTILMAAFIAVFDWNWLRDPIARMAADRTGRVLAINGALTFQFGWSLPRIRANAVTFSNPDWAGRKQMISADAVEITFDLPQLLQQKIVLSEVRLEHPTIFLEQSTNGRKNWLLDRNQQDENARIRIDRLILDKGIVGYDDAEKKTSVLLNISTSIPQPDSTTAPGVDFSASGQYLGQPFKASGSGAPVLTIRDESTPYALKVDVTVGQTIMRATGTITSLLQFSAMDMRLVLRGDNVAHLFPLLGIVLPATHAYAIEGQLLHKGNWWRYEKFTGRIGDSDIAGTLQVDTGQKRPAMKGELVSNFLSFADLGQLVGARPGSIQAARAAATPPAGLSAPAPLHARVLPDMPFKTDRWDSVDAEVSLKARAISHTESLPIENLATHLSLRDSVLTLKPLTFDMAGGHVEAAISLDGRKNPIQADGRVGMKNILLAKLFPTLNLNKAGLGQVNGEFDLAGRGNSVGRMLANSSGKAGLVIAGGKISRLMMEKMGLHLWEIFELKVTGDKLIKLHCGVAYFDIKEGVMRTDALIFDTEVTTIIGTGIIDLGQEKLDLTLNQKTKNTSLLALRSPIHVRGTLARPLVEVDKRRMTARALGAIALGILNPVLALIPLIDPGPGRDSDCAQLIRDVRATSRSAGEMKPVR